MHRKNLTSNIEEMTALAHHLSGLCIIRNIAEYYARKCSSNKYPNLRRMRKKSMLKQKLRKTKKKGNHAGK